MDLYLYFEGAKDIHVLQVLIWGCGGRWRFLTSFGIFIWICILTVAFDTPMIQIFALYLNFEGAKNINVL